MDIKWNSEAEKEFLQPPGHVQKKLKLIFDVEGQNYVIYKVGPRPGFYQEENLREVEKRI